LTEKKINDIVVIATKENTSLSVSLKQASKQASKQIFLADNHKRKERTLLNFSSLYWV